MGADGRVGGKVGFRYGTGGFGDVLEAFGEGIVEFCEHGDDFGGFGPGDGLEGLVGTDEGAGRSGGFQHSDRVGENYGIISIGRRTWW